jgi:hypothetical protein
MASDNLTGTAASAITGPHKIYVKNMHGGGLFRVPLWAYRGRSHWGKACFYNGLDGAGEGNRTIQHLP